MITCNAIIFNYIYDIPAKQAMLILCYSNVAWKYKVSYCGEFILKHCIGLVHSGCVGAGLHKL